MMKYAKKFLNRSFHIQKYKFSIIILIGGNCKQHALKYSYSFSGFLGIFQNLYKFKYDMRG